MAAVDFGDISEAFETAGFSPQYEVNATEKALREWCEFNSIEIKKD